MNNYFTVHRWVQLGKTTHSVWPRRCISSQGITMLHGFIELSISPHQQSTKRDHPIGSCGLVCKIDVAQQILQINCSSLFHEGLHSMFSQSIQSWWCAWCWLQMVNSILFRKFFSCEYTSIVKPSWSCQTWSGCDQVTVACELHPLPCSSNSRSAYSVAYLHIHNHLAHPASLPVYIWLSSWQEQNFFSQVWILATRQYFLQGPMLVTCQDVPGRSEDEEITAEATQLTLILQCIAREGGGSGKGRREGGSASYVCTQFWLLVEPHEVHPYWKVHPFLT